MSELQRTMAKWAAWLMWVSLLVGGLAAGGMSGTIPVDGRMLLAAHVTGVIGSLFIIAVAWTLPFLNYSDEGRRRLAWLLIISNWANVIIGTAKAPFAVHGVGYTSGSLANNVVFILLNLFVVGPTLVAAAAWGWGLRGAALRST